MKALEEAPVRALSVVALILGLLALPSWASAAGVNDVVKRYVVEFIATMNSPGASTMTATGAVGSTARGTMTITVNKKADTDVEFKVEGVYPNTLYTLWTVFNELGMNTSTGFVANALPSAPGFVPSRPPATLPAEANAVGPVARLDAGFTSGMGPDPGATFVTDAKGNGKVKVKLDYDIVNEGAPLANKDVIAQCVPAVLGSPGPLPAPAPPTVPCSTKTGLKVLATLDDGSPNPDADGRLVRLTTAWLRKYIGHVMREAREKGKDPVSAAAEECANFDPHEDPTPQQFWQCVDPATVDRATGLGLPRVYMFSWNHFRLAAHPDDLTHGFIGGEITVEDHRIDMVGLVGDLVQTK